MTQIEEIALPELSCCTQVFYKDRNGLTRELRVKQPMDPSQIRFTFNDIQMLAKQIAIQLKVDLF
jgi:hypothetical protein